jgi:TfoX/Sxy family transcriptional regulator of competence genes
MSTHQETVDFILEKLHGGTHFSARKMFGEYALYADSKVVALVCDDTLFVKILPASSPLENVCEKGPCYPGSKDYYIVTEDQLSSIEKLPEILLAIAASIPEKKKRVKK